MATDVVKLNVQFIPPTHKISLSVMVNNPNDWARIFSQFSELAENLGGSKFSDVMLISEVIEDNTHSEETLFKVQKALAEVMPLRDVADAIQQILNAGVLFRERT